MERYNSNGTQETGRDSARRVRSSSSSASSAVVSPATATFSQEGGFGKNIPVFLDRTFKMIELTPDDIVCWSIAGDSFIIKQVMLLEEILPSFYNHKNFMSFVRQLNFYGFKKMRGRASLRSKSVDGAAHGGAVATPKKSGSWEEYTHPQFRRGRPDLLADIRRKKDSGRLKRKRGESREPGILTTLATDVGTVSGDLKAVNDRLDKIMSLLSDMAGGHSQAAPNNPSPQSEDVIRHALAGGSGGRGGVLSFAAAGSGFENAASSTAPATRWRAGWEGGSGAIREGGHNPCAAPAAPLGYSVAPCLPPDQQQQGWQGRALYHRPSQHPSPAERYPALPNIRHLYTAPGSGVSTTTNTITTPPVAARASESAPTGPPYRHQPSIHLSRPWFSKVLSSSERKEGGRDTSSSCKVSPPTPGNGSGAGIM